LHRRFFVGRRNRAMRDPELRWGAARCLNQSDHLENQLKPVDTTIAQRGASYVLEFHSQAIKFHFGETCLFFEQLHNG
jgi:hypothetical protein